MHYPEILLILIFVFIQFFLGIITLLSNNVKIFFASMHQFNSTFCSTFGFNYLYLLFNISKERNHLMSEKKIIIVIGGSGSNWFMQLSKALKQK